MSLSVAIAVLLLADVALIAGLAYVMSRPARLTPHVASADRVPAPPVSLPAARRAEPAFPPRPSRSNAPVPAAS